jgi:hypothetical protein
VLQALSWPPSVLTKNTDAGDHVRLVLAGDVHNFQLFEPIDRNRPFQLVAGNGGTKLHPLDNKKPQRADESAVIVPVLWRRGQRVGRF